MPTSGVRFWVSICQLEMYWLRLVFSWVIVRQQCFASGISSIRFQLGNLFRRTSLICSDTRLFTGIDEPRGWY